MTPHRSLMLMLALVAAVPAAGDFIAYNDAGPGAQTHPNTTLYRPNATSSGFLVDVLSGQTTTVHVATTEIGVRYATSGSNPAPGTDAHALFNGFVDLSNTVDNGLEVSGNDFHAYTFTDLDPASTYDFAGTAIRANDNYHNRWTLVTLEGAASFTPAHSVGIGVYTHGLDANQVALWVGENHRADQGFVVRWTDIDPGVDATFRVVSVQYTGPVPTDVYPPGVADGSKGYALTGIRLEETLAIEGLPEIVNLPAGEITGLSAELRGEVVDMGSSPPRVVVYFGEHDGFNTPTEWDQAIPLGEQTGVFDIEIPGLTPGTRYYYRAWAENTVGARWAAPSATFVSSVVAPSVTTSPAQQVEASSARLPGAVTSTGGERPQVTLFYGTTAGTTPETWDHAVALGPMSGAFFSDVTGLQPDTHYFFQTYASNSAGAVWAPTAESFQTRPAFLPALTLAPATDVGGTSAVLHGRVTDTGGDVPVVTLYYGPSDGGANPANWDHAQSIGLQDDAFLSLVGALAPQTTHYFRAAARNAAGIAWVPASMSFVTGTPPVLTVVINEIHYDPDEKTRPLEFIELYNSGDQTIDLSGWTIGDAVDVTLPQGTVLESDAYFVVAQNAAEFLREFGVTAGATWDPTDRLSNQGERVTLRNAFGDKVDEVDYGVGFPWPTAAQGEGPSMELLHPNTDNDLGGAWRSSSNNPTPGRPNSVWTEAAPPRIRQVEHESVDGTSEGPFVSGTPVRVTAKITDPTGVASVTLWYQQVDPGDYIAIDDPRYPTDWTAVAMNDAGTDGDDAAGDGRYSVVLPGTLQSHRRLTRYRIEAVNSLAAAVRVPYPDDQQPNFAFFCYDGVPSWTGSAEPGAAPPVTYGSELLTSIPVYHLITTRQDHQDSQFIPDSTRGGGYGGQDYLWHGCLVYGDEVYDHIRYRARGGVWRYAMGKNMWKFDFNRARGFQARDDYGRTYDTTWDKLNFSALIQQGNFRQRGEQGLFEATGFRLHNLLGNPAPKTHYLHFRIVEHAQEQGPSTSQFDDDFQGLYLAVEQMDGRFLDEHELADGNLYKMEGGSGTLNNQGATHPTDKSDLNAFFAYKDGLQTPAWWRQHLDVDDYYNFRVAAMAGHDYDIHANKNYFYYHDPDIDKWRVLNWDLDLTWNTTYNGGGGDGPLNRHLLLEGRYSEFNIAYNNRVRETVDLVYNTDQMGMLLDEVAQWVYTPGQPSFVDADRALWDFNPILTSAYVNLSKASHGRFYENSPTGDFAGMIRNMRTFVANKVANYLGGSDFAFDPKVRSDEGQQPDTPTLTYVGAPGFPINALVFQSSPFASGGSSFAGMAYRIAEVTDVTATNFNPRLPRTYEIEASWESPIYTNVTSRLAFPGEALRVGRHYRARVRMLGDDGRWSHWSAPVAFVAGESDNALALAEHLKLRELMVNPSAGEEYEFIELQNTSTSIPLDLSGVKFTSGVDFSFPLATTLPPGAYIVVTGADATHDFAEFRGVYNLSSAVPVVGPYSGRLKNEGEQVTLKAASGGTVILACAYDSGRGWPVAADGVGHSLVPREEVDALQAAGALDYPGNWRPSMYLGGSPGEEDPKPPPSLVINEMVAHTDLEDPAFPDYDSNDWLELVNRGTTAVALTDWYLTDNRDTLRKWQFPAIVLAAGARLSVDEIHDFHQPITSGFGLNKNGEEVLLSHLPGTTEDRVVDAFTFKGQEHGVALARQAGDRGHRVKAVPTRDGDNLPPRAEFIITELMYNPLNTSTNVNEDDRYEFVEIFNPLHVAAPLFNATGPWRLRGAVDLVLPDGMSLAPDQSLVAVPFNPADAGLRALFLAEYGLTEGQVDLVGPYRGNLSDRVDRLALERPQAPDLPDTSISWVVVDEVHYGDQQPWPTSPDGAGHALVRVSARRSGNDPGNWEAAPPTPGQGHLREFPDEDGDRLTDRWEWSLFSGLHRDGAGDLDGDTFIDGAEFVAGTDPGNDASLLSVWVVSATSGHAVLAWHSVTGKTYTVQRADQPDGPWHRLAGDVAATPPTNEMTIPVDHLSRSYWSILVE